MSTMYEFFNWQTATKKLVERRKLVTFLRLNRIPIKNFDTAIRKHGEYDVRHVRIRKAVQTEQFFGSGKG